VTISILLGVFLSSLVSGLHCALMCTGFVNKSNEQIISFKNPQTMLLEYGVLHGTRILTYTILGLIAGKVGTIFWLQDILPLHRAMFVLAASILLWQAVTVTFRKKKLQQED
jgi:sulfite exporter TauE/SafE